jgi:acetoin utilization protein AcuC
VEAFQPELIVLQCGADGLSNDPLTHLQLTRAVHQRVTAALCRIADAHCGGRLLALGGGGYNRTHTAQAWVSVVGAMVGLPAASG